MGFQPSRRLRVRSVLLRGDAAVGARQALSRFETDGAGLVSAIRSFATRRRRISIVSCSHLATRMDFGIEGLHTERPGPACSKRRSRFDAALTASADKAALFKTFIKVLAQRSDMMATFMAKWSRDWPGQSGHIHLSLNGWRRQAGVLRRRPAASDESDHALLRRRSSSSSCRSCSPWWRRRSTPIRA